MRAYEDAATAIGRLDAAACLADSGFRNLLTLRCVATATGASHLGMIALSRAAGEGTSDDVGGASFARALREGSARSRGGALPSFGSLLELLRIESSLSAPPGLDELLHDTNERTPPVLKAALAALTLGTPAPNPAQTASEHRLTALYDPSIALLAVPLLLCVGGATTDAWITLPRSAVGDTSASPPVLREIFAALARDARAAEKGLLAARQLCDADETRVRDTLGRAAYSALELLALLRRQIVITVPDAAHILGLTPPTAGAAVARLVELGVARELTGRIRSRAFVYEGMVHALRPLALD
jgi:hypothetical protein